MDCSRSLSTEVEMLMNIVKGEKPNLDKIQVTAVLYKLQRTPK